MEEMEWVYLPVRVPNGAGTVFAKIDGDYDGEYFGQYKWKLNKLGYVWRTNNVKRADGTWTNRPVYLHREVGQPPKGMWASFKNGDKLDCRSCNIVLRTPKEVIAIREQSMRRTSRKNSTGYRGVHQVTTSRIEKDGLRHTRFWGTFFSVLCGVPNYGFPTAEEAARDYDRRAKEHYGERAVLNFPNEV